MVPKRPSRASRGFSLPEALVVISLIAMALMVAVPAINEQIRSAKVRTSAEQFTTSLRAARMISVAQRRPVEVRLVPAGSGNYYEYDGRDGQAVRVQLPTGAEIHPNSATRLEFQPNGALAAGPRTVYIEAEVPRGTERWSVHTNVIGVTTVSHQIVE